MEDKKLCPTCNEPMMLSTDGTHYECANPKCSDYRLLLLKRAYDKQSPKQTPIITTEKKTQDAPPEDPTDKARLWNGNQYWDEKKKKWRNGAQPRRLFYVPTWLVIVLICVAISIAVTIALNYTHPGSRYSFWVW